MLSPSDMLDEDWAWWLERRDTYRVLAEGARIVFPKMAKALREKVDRDLLEVLDAKS